MLPILLIGSLVEFLLMFELLAVGLVLYLIFFIPFGIKRNPVNYLWKIFDYYMEIECDDYATFCGKYRTYLWRKIV